MLWRNADVHCLCNAQDDAMIDHWEYNAIIPHLPLRRPRATSLNTNRQSTDNSLQLLYFFFFQCQMCRRVALYANVGHSIAVLISPSI